MSPNNLHVRQTPQALPATLVQPSTKIALSTTFTPPPSCALESQINILPPPGYLLWWNEPVPYTSVTISSCYPSEFLRSYTSIAPTSNHALGSSIVPAMSPLVCPENFCTQYIGADNYIACCPSGYKFATTGAPIVSNRPAYGGICYTDIPLSEKLTAVVYDSTGSAHQEIWAPSTTGAQGYAHPIDGWAKNSPVLGCPTKSSTSTKTKSSSSNANSSASNSSGKTQPNKTSNTKAKKKRISGGGIAGIVLAALAAFAAILGFILFLLKRRKNAKEDVHVTQQLMGDDEKAHQVQGDEIYQKDTDHTRAEMHATSAIPELDSSNRGAAGTHELGTERISELPARNQ
jgi:hypothetical protein